MKLSNETKIVVLGAYNSGKTTTLEQICYNRAKVEYNGTTTALDYGSTTINGKKVHFFGTPGQERFRFMRRILSEGLDGAILVVDNSKGITPTDQEILGRLKEFKVPYVVFSNKQDLNSNNLEIDSDAPVIPTIAQDGEGILDGVETLLEIIKS
ncbi:MAG TPA: GTP-binding protein [Methanobacterium subterraneum]|uniref:GTP-binding protein n=1 Tax=Methanobacterium subterraneum TaxID=59277 RepID=A0A7J4THC5_9EURY|nr:GTP-binding protein [Methanobacterium subterraneum]